MTRMRKMIARDSESGFALATSILLLTILAAVVAALGLVSIASLRSTIAVKDATYFDLVNNTAVSDVIRMANEPARGEEFLAHVGQENAIFGVMGDSTIYKWRWYLLPVNSTYSGLSYDAYVTSYRGDDPNDPNKSKTVIARITSFPTSGARVIGDSAFYRPTTTSVYAWGVFGNSNVSLGGSTSVSSYNSADSTTGTGVTVGTNESISISSGSTVPSILMMNSYEGHTAATRCLGAPCSAAGVMKSATYGMDLSVVKEWTAAACPGNPSSYPTVNASSITLNAVNNNCFNNVTLGGNVNISTVGGTPSSGFPSKVYILGNLDIKPGTTFNNAGNTAISGGMVYRFYVSGSSVFIGSQGATSGVLTDFRALLVASDTTSCLVGTGAIQTNFYGALVCGSLVTVGNTNLAWDTQTTSIANDREAITRIWSVGGYSTV